MIAHRRTFLALALAAVVALGGWLDADASGPRERGKIVVANRGSGTISVIDAHADRLIGNVALPQGAGDNPPEPMYVVNTQFKNRVWVGDRANNRVVVFDGDSFEVVDKLPAGRGVFHMETDAFDQQLWIVNDIDKTATVIDPDELEVLATVPLPADLVAAGAVPHDVILDPLGLFAYITFLNVPGPTDVVVQFSTETFAEIDRAEVGNFPHVVFNDRNWEVYCPCQDSNTVFVLDALSMEITDAFLVPGAHGVAMSNNGKRFYTTNLPGGGNDAVFSIDTRANEIIGGSADTAYTVPHNLALTPNGHKLFVTHSGPNNKVSIFRTPPNGPLEFAGEVTVQNNPFGLGYVK
jgi:DNA-binding beta-propeller fold protein YncE